MIHAMTDWLKEYITPNLNCKDCYGTGTVGVWIMGSYGRDSHIGIGYCKCVLKQQKHEYSVIVLPGEEE